MVYKDMSVRIFIVDPVADWIPGDVVRTAPNELSIATPQSFQGKQQILHRGAP